MIGYFLSTLSSTNRERPARCVGWYETLAEAKQPLEQNWGDLAEEGWYDLAAIEESHSGQLYPYSSIKAWYQWSDGQWQECPCPAGYERVGSLAIG